MTKVSMIISLWLASMWVLLSNPASAQSNFQAPAPNVTPPSPNASSLGKFADNPVGLYTGVPQISVPLFEIEEGDIKLPIRLDYHAGGIRLEENASWCGLGFGLVAGGVITRTVRGSRDEGGFGISGWINNVNGPPPEDGNPAHNEYFKLAADGASDTQPDIFYFNIMGRVGRFFIDFNGQVHTVPYQKITITHPDFHSWTVVTEDGMSYTFAKEELTQTITSCNGRGHTSVDPYTSAWYLTEIKSPKGNGKITLEYESHAPYDFFYQYKTIDSFTDYAWQSMVGEGLIYDPKVPLKCENMVMIHLPARLTKIKTSTLEVEFATGAERCDLKGDYVLDEIRLNRINMDATTTLVKKYKLYFKYLDGTELLDFNSPCSPSATIDNDPSDYMKRLMLTAVKEFDADGNRGKIYSFEYFLKNNAGSGLPSRLSFNQDHWGFFNGANNDGLQNPTLIPATTSGLGAIREAEASSAMVGSLKRIYYPTGGYSEFGYELHDIDNRGMSEKYESMQPMTRSFGIQYNTQTFGQVTVSEPLVVKTEEGETFVSINFGFPTDCTKTPCSSQQGPNPFCQDLFNFELWRYDGADGTYIAKFSTIDDWKTKGITLKNGTYKVIHTVKSGLYTNDMCVSYSIGFDWLNSEIRTLTFTTIGGLRINQITDYDPVAKNTSIRTYEYRAVDGKSSGTVVNLPTYAYDYQETTRTRYCMYTSDVVKIRTDLYKVSTSASGQPLGATQGSPVGYSRVTVYYGMDPLSKDVGLNGKTVSTFTDPFGFPDLMSYQSGTNIPCYAMQPRFPYPPNDNQDWLRGLPLETTEYARVGAAYRERKRTINEYDYRQNTYELFSWKAGAPKIMFSYLDGSCLDADKPVLQSWDFNAAVEKTVQPVKFLMRSGNNELVRTTVVDYDATDITKATTSVTDFTFSKAHLQLLQKTTKASDGTVTKLTNKYPGDFSSSTADSDWASAALAKMVAQNIIAVPVEQRTLVNDKLVNATFTKYKEAPTGKVYPFEAYIYRAAAPVIKPPTAKIEGGKLQLEKYVNGRGYEKAITFNAYNDHGNIVDFQYRTSPARSYVWDYDNTLPIAEVENATSAQVAYTSFEYDGTGGWTIGSTVRSQGGVTGVQSYQLGKVSKSNLGKAIRYKVSVWAKGSAPILNNIVMKAGKVRNGWTFYEKIVSGITSVTLSGTATIDEARILPVGATMKTYAYLLGVGVSAETDANNFILYYDYDGLGRLQSVKNEWGEIVKAFNYNYQIR